VTVSTAVTTGIFTLAGSLGGTTVGVGSTAFLQRAANRRADRAQAAERRRADHAQAKDLFVKVAKAAASIQAEIAAYRLRRDSKRARGLAGSWALLELGAAHTAGNWLRGCADGVRELRSWDMGESARFFDRFAVPAAEISAALMYLSLMSLGLQQAAIRVTEALDEVWKAKKPGDITAAGDGLAQAVGGLRRAVDTFTAQEMEP